MTNKLDEVDKAARAYHDALEKATPDQTSIEDKIAENFAESLSHAFGELGTKKMELLPEYFMKAREEKNKSSPPPE